MNYFMWNKSWISFACWRVTFFLFFKPISQVPLIKVRRGTTKSTLLGIVIWELNYRIKNNTVSTLRALTSLDHPEQHSFCPQNQEHQLNRGPRGQFLLCFCPIPAGRASCNCPSLVLWSCALMVSSLPSSISFWKQLCSSCSLIHCPVWETVVPV